MVGNNQRSAVCELQKHQGIDYAGVDFCLWHGCVVRWVLYISIGSSLSGKKLLDMILDFQNVIIMEKWNSFLQVRFFSRSESIRADIAIVHTHTHVFDKPIFDLPLLDSNLKISAQISSYSTEFSSKITTNFPIF